MVANAQELDSAIYTVDPPYAPDTDWPPALYRQPVKIEIAPKKTRKPRPQIRVVNPDGVIHAATDETLATVLQPKYEPLPCINQVACKYEGGLAMPKFTLRTPLRTPLGRRVLTPECSRYMLASDTFFYKFIIEEHSVKWYAENELSLGE